MKITTIHTYTGAARVIANRIKSAVDDPALEQAGEEMAEVVPENAQLVPAPSSSTVNRAMLVLARKIADLVPGARAVEAVLRTYPVPSSHLLRRAGMAPLTVQEHKESMALNPAQTLDAGDPVVLIDNVVTAGHTLQAMESIIGRPVEAVVYADASRGRAVGLAGGTKQLRICFSGSRDYPQLEQIDWVLATLPQDIIVVHGGAKGVDQYVDAAAKERRLPVEIHRPDWSKGRKAGPMRNREMVATCDYVIAFWDGVSRGTASTIQAAIDMEKEFIVFSPWAA